ncbi:MAG: ferrous iron transport protein B [Chloroflexi bacterium]|nr:MAG: ferrous iron transport protein B [Chloroflexota bacterium]
MDATHILDRPTPIPAGAANAAPAPAATAGFSYSPPIEAEITGLSAAIAQVPALAQIYPPRWLAIKLLEQDEPLLAEVKAACGGARVMAALGQSLERLHHHFGDDVDIVLADQRYSFVNQLVQRALSQPANRHHRLSDRVDQIVTHRWLGIPIFLALMWVVFKITTDIATPYIDWVDAVISGPISHWAAAILGAVGLGGTWLESLLLDGVIAGVGGVLVFVPVLMWLYVALAVLEDTGYMARAAFVMDRVMQKVGLHGKSFLPMVVGFGCSVPGLYATRTLEHRKDRILTGLLVPFMSCGARLPVYVLFATVFFPRNVGLVVFSMYLIGIAVAIALGVLLKGTLFKAKEETPFLIEMPPYRKPNLKTVWFYVWERTSTFIKNAWTIILVTSIIIWFLMATPVNGNGRFANTDIEDSAFGLISGAAAPVFAPLGFGSWESSGALISGFVAKEVIVSTTAQVYHIPEPAGDAANTTTFAEDVIGIGRGFAQATLDTLKAVPLIVGINLFDAADDAPPTDLMATVQTSFNVTSGGFGALAAFAFMVFVLLYTPCMVTVAAMRQELGTKWMWLSVTGQFAIAWLAALIVFQGGRLLLQMVM